MAKPTTVTNRPASPEKRQPPNEILKQLFSCTTAAPTPIMKKSNSAIADDRQKLIQKALIKSKFYRHLETLEDLVITCRITSLRPVVARKILVLRRTLAMLDLYIRQIRDLNFRACSCVLKKLDIEANELYLIVGKAQLFDLTTLLRRFKKEADEAIRLERRMATVAPTTLPPSSLATKSFPEKKLLPRRITFP